MDAAELAWIAAGGSLPLPPKPTDVPAEVPTSIVVITDQVLTNARYTATALDNIADGLHVSPAGLHDYLTDGANYLRELSDAVESYQRAGV